MGMAMAREQLNLYLDGLLSLSRYPDDISRERLVQVCGDSESFEELLGEWIWVNGLSPEILLNLKLWFGLRYQNLADLFGLSIREVDQMLRGLRVRELGGYPELSHLNKDAPDSGRISCFMVEQRLSAWVDTEWEDLTGLKDLQAHLERCQNCRERLKSYRRLQMKILGERKEFLAISEEEWSQLQQRIGRQKIRNRAKWLASVIIAIIVFIGIVWVINSKSERAPNIYEIIDEQK